MSPINLLGTIKLIAQIGNIAAEIGEYAAPIVEHLVTQRAKGPRAADGTERTVAAVQATIDHALRIAREGQAAAQGELDALAKKAQ